MDGLKRKIKDNLSQVVEMLRFAFPKGKVEWCLFSTVFLFYFCCSCIVIFKTTLVDYPFPASDLYFGFDSTDYYQRGWSYIQGHPLMDIFTIPLVFIGRVLTDCLGSQAKAIASVVFTSLLITLSVVYVYRYLRVVVSLEHIYSLFFTLTYVFFSTNIILAFTTESFTLSLFFLSFSVCFYSIYLKSAKNVMFLPGFLIAITLGGITITNIAKGILLMLFSGGNFKKTIIKIAVVCISFFLVLLLAELRISSGSIVNQANTSYNAFTYHSEGRLNLIVSLFIGSPLFFSEVINYNGIIMWLYKHWWQFLYPIMIILMIAFSIFKGRKNKMVWMLTLLLLTDFGLHVLLRFGLAESFMYGGHWVYLVPLYVGWLFYYLGQKFRRIFLILFTCFSLGLVINNIYKFHVFVKIATIQFPRTSLEPADNKKNTF